MTYHVQSAIVVQTIDGLHQERVQSNMLDLLGSDFLMDQRLVKY